MKRNLTEVVFILDASGSMHNLVTDVVGGFNSTLAEQRAVGGECLISTVLFNSYSRVLHDRVPIEKTCDMGIGDFRVGGMTALYDAVGDAVRHISNVHKYAREEDIPERTLVIITTDGQENASRRYSASAVKELIELKKSSGWEFIFLGANIDAREAAGRIGIDEDRAANYEASAVGVDCCYRKMSNVISNVRVTGKVNGADWRNK